MLQVVAGLARRVGPINALLTLLLIALFPAVSLAQTGPTISSVSATSVAATSDIIRWSTNVAADSQVEYGTAASYGSITVRDTFPRTAHSMALIGLAPSTLYHYRVRSRNAAGNLSVTPDSTFTTPATGSGVTYFVEKTACSDSFAGTSAQPWCTLSHASSKLQPGDTVIVGAGTYNESVTPPSGSVNAYISYEGQSGAILNGNNTAVNGQAFDIGTQSYLIISSFEITNYKNPRPAGNSVDIYGTAHDIELSHLTVHDNWNGIIMSDDANQITINDCLVFNSRYGVGFENTVHDVFISRVTSHSNKETYIGTVSSYGNGDGFSDDLGTSHLFIRDSVAYDNLDAGFDIKAVYFECTNCLSRDNIKYGFRLWDAGGPYTLINSVSYGNGLFPLQLLATSAATSLYNSTFISGAGDQGFVIEGPPVSLLMRNCILYGYTNQAASGGLGAADEDYNLFFSTQGSVGFTPGAHSKNANPAFVNPAGHDYHLSLTSPAIDAGFTIPFINADFDGNPRPLGPAFDLGAFEFNPQGLTPPNAPTGLKITVK
ncbi:MAG: choice-of-anchor Q domain-containing protein [Candidatus Acidiferrales bacterium]